MRNLAKYMRDFCFLTTAYASTIISIKYQETMFSNLKKELKWYTRKYPRNTKKSQ